jgi:phosphatidylglycerophosphatase A
VNSNNLIQNVQMTKATAITAPFWARVITTFFGIGYLQPGPGTWASALTLLVWWLLSSRIEPAWQPWLALLLALAVTLLCIPAATRVAAATGIKDPQFVVIDEVAGQLLTMIAVPVSWKSLLLGFILFRGFDISKPPPIRRLERLPGGMGIVVDDLGAGLYALVAMHLFLHLDLLPR